MTVVEVFHLISTKRKADITGSLFIVSFMLVVNMKTTAQRVHISFR